MNFASASFMLWFLPLVLASYYLICFVCRLTKKDGMTLKNIWMLLASIFFYAWGEPTGVLLLCISIIINHLLGLWTAKHQGTATGKRIVALAVAYNVGAMALFKYVGVVYDMLEQTTGFTYSGLGLSFFTFSAISFVVDIYRKKAPKPKSLLDSALFMSLFIKMISGPIVSYEQFVPMLTGRRTTLEGFSQGVRLFIRGLARKIIFASGLVYLCDKAFSAAPGELSVLFAWIGAVGYFLQIYYDFAGYSDMARGLGFMFGFDIPVNFDYPYASTSIAEFWRRWHMTLGAWFRNYVYYPLTLGPAIKLRKYVTDRTSRKAGQFAQNIFTLFVIWFLIGLWHGASWTYIIWAMLQFAFILWEQNRKPIKNKRLANAFGWIYTVGLSFITKPLVRAHSITAAGHYYAAMFGLSGNALFDDTALFYLNEYAFYFIAGLIFAFPVLKKIASFAESKGGKIKTAYDIISSVCIILVFFISMAYVLKNGYTPFVYQKY